MVARARGRSRPRRRARAGRRRRAGGRVARARSVSSPGSNSRPSAPSAITSCTDGAARRDHGAAAGHVLEQLGGEARPAGARSRAPPAPRTRSACAITRGMSSCSMAPSRSTSSPRLGVGDGLVEQRREAVVDGAGEHAA